MGGRASTASKDAWNKRNYDSINVRVPKGEKERIKEYAEHCGESVNGFINRLIQAEMEREEGS